METWSESQWRLAIEQLDQQHEGLIRLAGDLKQQAGDRESRSQCLGTCQQLVVRLDQHFQLEEDLMRQVGFPERLGHRELHLACMREMTRLQSGMEKGLIPSPEELEELFEIWIFRHLQSQDHRFEHFLDQQRRQAAQARA